jgi:MFS family permease
MSEENNYKHGTSKVRRIGKRNIVSILFLGTAGQIAWTVENSWFNTFVYDRITTNPAPVAWMVIVSAITATLTTIMMGILSDRTVGKWGKRKPYIVFGYILWGVITAIYPMVQWIQTIGIAILMVIITDAVMTFFGSTANDAAYNAWLTDIGHSSNRNRIQSINNITFYLAALIAFVAAGVIIDIFGYFVFFYVLGGLVTLTGVISAVLIKSTPVNRDEISGEKYFFKEFAELINPKILKENRTLFLLFLSMALTGIGTQIYMPYLFIFMENYVGFSKIELSLFMAIFLLLTIVILVFVGIFSHRFNRKTLVLIGSILGGIFTIILGFSAFLIIGNSSLAVVIFLLYLIATIPALMSQVAHGGWLLDKYPEGDVGKFQGIRMIFMVLLPMVFGPPIGSAIISTFGIPMADGYIPTPEIFIVGGLISLFSVIPILFIRKAEGQIILDAKDSI